jgi:hypothetical protein
MMSFLILRKLRYASCVIPQTQRTGKGPLSAKLDRAVKLANLRELKAVSEKVDYCDAGDELEAMELRELPPKPV